MTEISFEITSDPFPTSAKSLDELESEEADQWRQIAAEHFKENPEELEAKVEELKQKLLEFNVTLPRNDNLSILKFLRAGGGSVETALEVGKNYVGLMMGHMKISRFRTSIESNIWICTF